MLQPWVMKPGASVGAGAARRVAVLALLLTGAAPAHVSRICNNLFDRCRYTAILGAGLNQDAGAV